MNDGGKGAGEGIAPQEPLAPRRLVDAPPPSQSLPSGAWALSLLRSASPYRPPIGRKQRVRLGLGQAGKRRRSPLLRPAIAGLVLIGCGAAASAALGRWPDLVAQAYHRLLAPPPVDGPPAVEARARHGAPHASPTPALSAPALPSSSPAPVADIAGEAVAAAAPGSSAATHGPQSPIAVRPSPRVPSAAWRPRRAPPVVARVVAAPSEDTSPVLDAMRALRVDGNPARARALLAGYLERHPNGTLAEEALAMTIEAAVAHGDGDAAALARRYLRRYPAGHFSALAHQTLEVPLGIGSSAPR